MPVITTDVGDNTHFVKDELKRLPGVGDQNVAVREPPGSPK